MALPSVIDYTLPTAAMLPAPMVDWQLDPARSALLLHDLQPHFLKPCAPALREAVLSNAAALLAVCRRRGIPVAHTHQPNDQTPEQRGLLTDFWGPGPRSTTAGETPHDPLAPVPGEAVIERRRYNAFLGTDLDGWLKDNGRDQLIVCGIYAHIGCLMTSAHAFMTERQPFLVADATADFSAEEHRMALEYVSCRLGRVTTTDEAIVALDRTPAPAPRAVASVDELRAEVAALVGLPVEEVAIDDELGALGLDSMRRMRLVEDWADRDIEVDFMDVAMAESCQDLHALLAGPERTAA